MRRYLPLLLMLAASACQCGPDPCEGVECPTGLVCIEGSCVLDTSDGGTLECTIDLDCAGVLGRTHCDAASRRCVECTVTAHCDDPQNEVCDIDANRCVPRPPCQLDTDCADLPATPWCEPVSRDCVSCREDAHCPGRQQACDLGGFFCRFDPCGADLDCQPYADAPFCDTGSGICQECVRDSQCEAGEVCRDGLCQSAGDCARNDDCRAGEVCNRAGVPFCAQCASSADCRLGGICSGGRCTASSLCTGDADCGSPFHCASATGTCVDCTDDAHCAAGQSCGADGTCEAPAACGAAALCLSGQECSGSSCTASTCTDDLLEPNDYPYFARPMEPGRVADVTLCPNTWDWFVAKAAIGDGLIVEATYDTSAGHPTLLVWTGSGGGPVLVGQPALTATGQRLEVSSLSRAGPIYIGLRGHNTALGYTLDLTVEPDGLCEDDDLEPNDSAPEAELLPDPVQGRTGADAISCFADEDWFAVTAPAGMRTIATATPTDGSSATSLILSIFVQDIGGVLRLVGGSGTNSAEAPARSTSAQMLVRVSRTTIGATPYRLDVQLRPPRPNNDSCFSPAGLLEGFTTSGTTAGGTDDGATACGGEGSSDVVYVFTLSETRAVSLATTGSLDAVLALRTSCTNPSTEVLCNDRPGDQESLDAVLGAGTYTVWVDGFGGAEGAFDLTFTTSDPPPPPANEDCASPTVWDELAGGDTESGDVAVAADDLVAGCGGAGGDATFQLDLSSPASLTLTAAGTPGLSVSVRSDCADDGSEVACAVVPDGADGVLDIPFLDAGSWTIVVDGGGVGGGAFDLAWALGSPIPPPANESCAAPEPLVFVSDAASTSGDTRNAADDHDATCALSGQSGGDVVYSFALLQPRQLSATLGAGFDGVLELRRTPCADPASAVACSDTVTPTVYRPSLASGLYYLVVDGYAGGKGPFTLDVALSAPLLPPANDGCAQAELLDVSGGSATASGYTWLGFNDSDRGVSCTGSAAAGPDVYYEVPLLTGQTLTATATPTSAYDLSVYLLDACDATACLAGSDVSFVNEPETVTWTATGDGSVWLVVDGYSAGGAGFFDLQVDVQ